MFRVLGQWEHFIIKKKKKKSLVNKNRKKNLFYKQKDGEGNGIPLQYFCLENPTDGGAWKAAVHGVARVGHD